jgi:hypothetical protein
MISEGRKSSRDTANLVRADLDSTPVFACLTPFLDLRADQLGQSFENLARVLDDAETTCRIHVRVVEGDDTVGTWDIKAGTATPSFSADAGTADQADVLVVVARTSWMEIAQGRLAPFDAMFSGRLRVGGDLELAKRVTRQLSDPSVPYVAPC